MSAEAKPTSDPAGQNAVPASVRERMRFYRVRNRIYTGLLVFVVAAGLPVVGVPFLRHRLNDRVQVLKQAIAGGYDKAVVAKVGENPEPFPAEYEHPVARPNYPKLPAYFNTAPSQPIQMGRIYPPRPAGKSKSVQEQQPPAEPAAAPAQPAQAEARQPETPSEDAAPVYRQGKLEQEVYDVLLKSDAKVAALVEGKNPSYNFKSWDVAGRGEDLYWVRIVFTQMPAKTDVECIWQVQLMSKQVMPLNYNARSLPRN